MKTRNTQSLESRFWSKVNKTDGCWLWTGATTNGGYGVIRGAGRGSKLIRANRLSWELEHGIDAGDKDVCHTCDNPKCVRPDHLFVGYASDNVRDMVNKGRAGGGTPPGEAHHRAKLTESAVRQIRSRYAAGRDGLQTIAHDHGVSKKTIFNVVHGLIWRGV
jgi:HNH endonuclease